MPSGVGLHQLITQLDAVELGVGKLNASLKDTTKVVSRTFQSPHETVAAEDLLEKLPRVVTSVNESFADTRTLQKLLQGVQDTAHRM